MSLSDIKCPYCGQEQEINHDDGYGYDEGEEHEQDCVECARPFKFFTSISYHYEVHCAGEHELENDPAGSHPNLYNCAKCDYYELRMAGDES